MRLSVSMMVSLYLEREGDIMLEAARELTDSLERGFAERGLTPNRTSYRLEKRSSSEYTYITITGDSLEEPRYVYWSNLFNEGSWYTDDSFLKQEVKEKEDIWTKSMYHIFGLKKPSASKRTR